MMNLDKGAQNQLFVHFRYIGDFKCNITQLAT